MQFKVPQDVQQADRIVAFLTLPQLIICIVGFAIAYGVYAALNNQGLPLVFWLPPVIIIGALTAAFAFLRIANLPFHQYLALLLERFITPSRRVWVKGGDRVIDDVAYVSTEDKQQQDKDKKMNEVQLQKEEKMKSIDEITDILDTLKKEPEASEVLKPIDETSDKDLLQASFLEKGPEPVKSPQTAEEKIKSLSQLPKQPLPSTPTRPSTPGVVSVQTVPSADNLQAGEPKKRKRRRRKKKRSGEQNGIPQALPQASPESSFQGERGASATGEVKTLQASPKAPEQKPAPVAMQEPKKPEVQVQQPAKPVQPAPQPAPSPEAKRSEPPLPSWLNETPKPPKAESEDRNPRPPAPPEKKAAEPTPPKMEEKKEPPAPASVPPSPPKAEPPKPEIKPEEPLLEAPQEELDLPAPRVELDLPAPPEELDLPAPKAAAPTSPTEPPSPQEPTSPSPKVIKIEDSFTPEELKQGQVIKIPKQ